MDSRSLDSSKKVGIHSFWSTHDCLDKRTEHWHTKLIPPFRRLSEEGIDPFLYCESLGDKVVEVASHAEAAGLSQEKAMKLYKEKLGQKLNDIALSVIAYTGRDIDVAHAVDIPFSLGGGICFRSRARTL